MKALVQSKRMGNLLNEVLDLSRQIAQALDRNDQVAVEMLIAMRQEPITKLEEAKQALQEQGEDLENAEEALRLVEVEQENGEDSSAPPAVVTKTGVYAFVNGRVEFREAAIVHEGGDYYVVRPVGAGRKVLRDGDTILIGGTGLQDGLRLEN